MSAVDPLNPMMNPGLMTGDVAPPDLSGTGASPPMVSPGQPAPRPGAAPAAAPAQQPQQAQAPQSIESQLQQLLDQKKTIDAQLQQTLAAQKQTEQQKAASYDAALADQPQMPAQEQFNQQQPIPDHEAFAKTAPLLTIFAALGGKLTKMSGLTMLKATNAMIAGTISGNQEAYTQAKKVYDDEYAKFAERQKQKMQIYKDQLTAWKDTYQGREKSWQIASSAVGDTLTQLKDVQTNETSILRAQAQLMKEKKAKQAAMAGPGGGSLDQGAVAMAKEGAPQTMIVKGIGKNSGLEWSAIRRAAIMQIADEEDMSIDEAGAEFARRQLDFGATKGSQNQLQKMLGASRAAVKQLDFNIGKTIETLKSMPGSDLSPITNAIARGEQKWTGDPKYSQLFFFMHASLMESARILSGGQASIAQLQTQAAEDAKKWANVNMTPESFINGAAPAMLAEGKNRLETYEQAYNEQRNRRDRPSSGGSAPDSGAAMSLDDYLKSQGH